MNTYLVYRASFYVMLVVASLAFLQPVSVRKLLSSLGMSAAVG